MSNTISERVPINRNLAGDFIGFTFDNIHSSDFNLIRVSNGSRYESDLLPSFQDATVQGEGKDGVFYFGTTFRERPLKISTAFDNLTEINYRKLTEKFSEKKLHKLWFDETPYKVYYVKLKTPPVFKNICFDEGEGRERIYRGEMELQFTCYPSFAESRVSHINENLPEDEFVLQFDPGDYTAVIHNHGLGMPSTIGCFYKKYGAALDESYNAKEWSAASQLEEVPTISLTQETNEGSETTEISEGIKIPIYNPGLKEADIKIIFTPNEVHSTFPGCNLSIVHGDQTISTMGIKPFEFVGDSFIAIDSKTHLISGLTTGKKLSGKVYNKYHIKGDFFEIPKAEYGDNYYLEINGGSPDNWTVEYKFYYV